MIPSSLKFQNICGVTDSSSAIANRLDKVTVGIFASAALFELVVIVYTILYALRSQASTGRYTAGRLAAAVTHGNMLYALSLFATSIVNIIFVALPVGGSYVSLNEYRLMAQQLSGDWHGVFINFQGVLHGVLGSRILFDLQGALSQGISLQILTNAETRMDFASVPLSDLSANGF
ncbi:hypothetical protein EV401DRAFT_2075008 [Pisolithus croceorrhizus]|nr:hypothetical protein EV401DRAFT_2075008 [Pisolithus croceorrhizus]